jgi:uncharacterized protein
MKNLDRRVVREVLDAGRFELIVLPTERCNLRCTYCYEDFSQGRMPDGVVQALKDLLAKRADGSTDLLLSWFGGEPLMASDIVLDVSRYAQELWASCGREYSASITTNASRLSRPLAESLVAAGVRQYQITLDGPEATHDARRRRLGGGGTFRTIWQHLEELAELMESEPGAAEVLLRLHYDSGSIASLEQLIAQVIDCFGGRPGWSVNLHELELLGGDNDHLILPPTRQDRTIADAYAKRLEEAGFSVFQPEKCSQPVCYAARPNSLVVRSDGTLSKCTVALSQAYNIVGRLARNGEVQIDNAALQPWLRGLYSGDEFDLACPNSGLQVES